MVSFEVSLCHPNSIDLSARPFAPAPFDVVPRPEPNDHLNPIFCYLGEEGVKKYLTHP
jgi:hypothetical protein